jgi:transglutaminase-like putative cysteine protease
LVIIADSLVELQKLAEIPEKLGSSDWQELDYLVAQGDYWEMLLPSEFTQPTPKLLELARQLEVVRRDDPLSLLRELNARLNEYFEYVPRSTRVDSPIDEAITTRQGVCQDFAHTMIALVRLLGIPCRYVSGYLHHSPDISLRSVAVATHAWVDAFLPHLGWVGFDPTNNVLAHESHIRTALGRDYADVPPTRGIYRGGVAGELHVAVQVSAHQEAPPLDQEWPVPEDWSMHVERALEPPPPASPVLHLQQIEQQQQ